MNPNEQEYYEQLKKQQEMVNQIHTISAQFLTKEARERLGNIRTVKPELASQIELQLVQLVQTGQIKGQITDNDLKEMLRQLQSKNNFKIQRK